MREEFNKEKKMKKKCFYRLTVEFDMYLIVWFEDECIHKSGEEDENIYQMSSQLISTCSRSNENK
jgi:hypothetical protein